MKQTFNVSWRQANRNWFVVDEDSGEIHAKVLEAEGTWLANAFPSLCCQFWSEKDAKLRVERELAGATDCTYRFVDARERRRKDRMDAKFADGDVVQLVSGGPPMTVQNDRVDGIVSCWWFVGDELRSEAFLPVALRRVELD